MEFSNRKNCNTGNRTILMMKIITYILLFGFITVHAQTKKYDLYRIVRGDTYKSIAKKFNMTESELKSINSYKEDEKLLIGVSVFVKPLKNSNFHIVRPKETLYSISKKHNITVEKLKRLNGLKSNIIRIGMRLKIR